MTMTKRLVLLEVDFIQQWLGARGGGEVSGLYN